MPIYFCNELLGLARYAALPSLRLTQDRFSSSQRLPVSVRIYKSASSARSSSLPHRGPGSKSAEIYFSVLYARSTPEFRLPVTLYSQSRAAESLICVGTYGCRRWNDAHRSFPVAVASMNLSPNVTTLEDSSRIRALTTKKSITKPPAIGKKSSIRWVAETTSEVPVDDNQLVKQGQPPLPS